MRTNYKEPKVEEYWLILNDLHVGSDLAPMPKQFKTPCHRTGDVNIARPNAVQKLLNKCWDHMLGNLPKLKGVIVNGDMCDGPNKRGIGKNEWTTDLGQQVDACAQMLKQIKEATGVRNWYFTQGSEYHVLDDRSLDAAVAEKMGGEFDDELVIEALNNEFRIHAHHVINGGMGAWQYRTTSLARDMMLMELNSADQEYGSINWVLRAHAHYFVNVNFSASKGGTINCGWQAKTRFSVKKGMVNVPKIGYSLLKIYDDGSGTIVPTSWKTVRPCKVVRPE